MMSELMLNEFVVVWMMVSVPLLEVWLAMEKVACMGVDDKDEILEVAVEDMMVAS